jgi:hypothetical protein
MDNVELERVRYGDHKKWLITVVVHGFLVQIMLNERQLTKLATLIKNRNKES